MRRKSTRNAAKASPEKPKKSESPLRRSRRQSKRRKKSSSDSSEDSVEESKTLSELKAASSPTKAEWKVVSSPASEGSEVVQKLKISLARPNVVETKRQTRSSSGMSDIEAQSAEVTDGQEDEKREVEVKGKGKSRDKNKLQKSSQFSEAADEKMSEISENTQVTTESPSIEIPVDNGENVVLNCSRLNDTESAAEQRTGNDNTAETCEETAQETVDDGANDAREISLSRDDPVISAPETQNDAPVLDDKVAEDEPSKVDEEAVPSEDILEAATNSIIETEVTEAVSTTETKEEEVSTSEVEEEAVPVAKEVNKEEAPVVEAAVEEIPNDRTVENDSVPSEPAVETSGKESKSAIIPTNDEAVEKMDLDLSETEQLTNIQEQIRKERPETKPLEKRTVRKFKLKLPSSAEDEPSQQQKSAWGRSATVLKMIEPNFVKVDLDGLQNIYPNIEMLSEDDVKLEVSPPVERRRPEKRKMSTEEVDRPVYKSQLSDDGSKPEDMANIIALNRKISIVDDTVGKLKPPPSPAKNPPSAVLYITNLVRPFTLKQLKELLERTGKLIEDGFWTDRIKSKCYVHYESQEEAEATRNALHGVQWPIGNGKKLIIEFATPEDLEIARNPPQPAPVKEELPAPDKENEAPVVEASKDEEPDLRFKKRKEEHIREWDVGKTRHRESKSRSRSRDRHEKRRRKHSQSPIEDFVSKKHQKIEEPVPQKLMDDLFQKTKAMPSVYWQPLTPEEIATKQQQRLMRMAEHKRRMEETAKNRGHEFGRGTTYKRRYD